MRPIFATIASKIAPTIVASFAALVCCLPVLSNSAKAATRLVYISNLPDIDSRPGLAEVAGLLASLRAAGDEVYLLHGGDSLAPSTLAAFDRGAHMIALLNSLNPVAMGVAKREFAFGEDELTLRAYEAAFPMLSNNLLDPETGMSLEGLVESSSFTSGSQSVCITAAVSLEVHDSYLPDRVQTRDPIDATRASATRLRSSGCDVVIALFGAVEERQRALLAEGLVDLVIGAESHIETAVHNGAGTWVWLRTTDTVAVVIDIGAGDECVVCKVDFRELDAVEEDAELRDALDVYRDKLAATLDLPVGRTLTSLDTRRDVLRTRENAFGNLVADALRSSLGADVAIINAGGIRGNRIYPADSMLTRGDLQKELPFRNRVTLLELTGSQLRDALENGLAGYQLETGGFPQLSGMALRFDPERPVGERVIEVRVAGEALVEGANYRLATVEFLARGGDGYSALTRARPLRSSINALLWDTVRGYIDAKESVAPTVEGRLINVLE
ncbi:MAG: 5'-nucleotidase C-terminal domain-containing protein [Pseudomonadota bacterium]